MECGFCGASLVGMSSRAIYCSRACKEKAKQKRNRADGKQHRPTPAEQRIEQTANCVDCGATFSYMAGRGAKRRRCPEHYAGQRPCALCGEMCQPKLGKHHCRACNNDLKLLAGDTPLEVVKPCGGCGEPFVAEPANSSYCTKACSWQAYRQRNLDRVRAQWLVNRARGKGAEAVEYILPSDVFERDGGICQLCDYPVNPTVEVPNPFAVTIDHKTPLSKGGSHTMENVQLAHFYCNSAKGDREEFQLTTSTAASPAPI